MVCVEKIYAKILKKKSCNNWFGLCKKQLKYLIRSLEIITNNKLLLRDKKKDDSLNIKLRSDKILDQIFSIHLF